MAKSFRFDCVFEVLPTGECLKASAHDNSRKREEKGMDFPGSLCCESRGPAWTIGHGKYSSDGQLRIGSGDFVYVGDHEVKSGAPKGPAVLGLECGDVEKHFPGHDGVGQLDLSFRQQVGVERVDFLPFRHGGIDAALDPGNLPDQFELLGIERGARFV